MACPSASFAPSLPRVPPGDGATAESAWDVPGVQVS